MSGIIGDNTGRGTGLIKAAGGGGKIGQVLSATDTTQRTTNSATYTLASSTLTVDITPAATSSKILVFATIAIGQSSANQGHYTIYRDSTNLSGSGNDDAFMINQVGDLYQGMSMSFLDSPSSTSALTYQVRIKTGSTNHNTKLQYSADTMSTITVMEVLV